MDLKTQINTKTSAFIALLFILFATQGCTVKFGHDFDPKGFHDWAKRGETTTKQVQEKLGVPTSQGMVMENDGTTLKRYIYYYGKGSISNMKSAKFKMLEVRFDENNLLTSFNWSAATEEKAKKPE